MVSSGLMTPAMTDADAVISGCWEFGGLGSPLAWAGKRNPKGLRLFAPWGEVSHADGCDTFIGQVKFFLQRFFSADFAGRALRKNGDAGYQPVVTGSEVPIARSP